MGLNRESDAVAVVGDRLEQGDAVAAARDHEAEQQVGTVGQLACGERVGAHAGEVCLEPQRLARARHPEQVVVERKGTAGVQPHNLERAVAAEQTLVGRGNHGVRHRQHLAIDHARVAHAGSFTCVAARAKAAPRSSKSRNCT